ncbi:AlkA N-terminal domain-containing protein [Allobranchiibius huperziae]|uniref:DNA-3-methyladenine glycosylase II n=1 Tax=Allobranchiibius huperziae TaxID=1874116 RepID=A0A853DA61_9MICO|nr:AlkA N-terminal domain-containing protein [Allobranchiibius huperziae]NYJ73477.1 AraC family transcriptional regulator of adaptative response / DNA-3-methyladenine glycosylase II [Allobranchiibius huperziae]
MHTDTDACLRAVRSRDARFDGWFVTGVRSTGIYCRPSCPATPPKARNITFLPTAAAAQSAGFRACKRCRPDASPGSPEWNVRADLVGRAMRLIGDGVVDRDGVTGLAQRLGYSVRQIERAVQAELGAGPLAIARAGRAQSARILIETTTLPLAQVAHASGFGSIRAFNEAVQEVFAMTPSQLRAAKTARGRSGTSPERDPSPWQRLSLRLPFRAPFHPDNVFGHLAATGVPGVEEWRDGRYRRTLDLPGGPGIVELSPTTDHVRADLALTDLSDLTVAVSRCRWLLDLDCDPEAVDAALAEDPHLAPLVRRTPGRRVPRTVDSREMAIRLVLGQQVSTKAARTHAGRLAATFGAHVDDPGGGLTRLFPGPEALLTAGDESFAMPVTRRETIRSLCRVLSQGSLDTSAGADREEARRVLGDVPGIGPWTVESYAMRALGDPDAFPGTDLGVRIAARALGIEDRPRVIESASARWRPWRSYAVQHLWATGDHEANKLPEEDIL